ncbi:MAG: hypothetical protein IAB81_05190 [Bacteroidetes bacterium]|uniref:Uncharacterized protein n=1 Tax=Candidatus Merdivivens pullicola TaxID=2840872 RepID=A0A9D9IIW9_9BACT|nr:hypothetical protein [Candidatus Merdivivens pullicola]
MKRKNFTSGMLLSAAILLMSVSCEKETAGVWPDGRPSYDDGILEEVAVFLSDVVSDSEVLDEVHSAVTESYECGYDEEYLFSNVVNCPGRGTGFRSVKAEGGYGEGALFRSLVSTLDGRTGFPGVHVKSAGTGKAFLDSLASSDIQIYWPYSENWDGASLPVVTFDHGLDKDWNYGFILRKDASGEKLVSRVLVDEAYAKEHPVWVVNLNKDRSYVPLKPSRYVPKDDGGNLQTKTGETIYSLMLRSFTALKNYDCWLAGASEYFIKVGAVENFTASTEAEMELFSPTITDFYIVVRRGEVGEPKEVNTIMVSDWTLQMSSIAFMIIEDDGGKQTSWDTEIIVKVNSKSYGITMSIPLNTKDDIVWRGSLSSRYLFATDASHSKFNDVLLDIEIVETYNNSDW